MANGRDDVKMQVRRVVPNIADLYIERITPFESVGTIVAKTLVDLVWAWWNDYAVCCEVRDRAKILGVVAKRDNTIDAIYAACNEPLPPSAG